MKNSILSMAVAALFFVGCGNNNGHDHAHDGEGAHEHTEGTHEHSEGTHIHEDGSVHQNHPEGEHHQEEFKVENDSISKKKEARDTSRESGNPQQ